MNSDLHAGYISLKSSYSVDDTLHRVDDLLAAKDITLFSVIDHSGEAKKVGTQMPNTKLLIFGNPKAGTPIMLAAPRSALDLPLKLLVSEDSTGTVWMTYNSPSYLRTRYNIPEELSKSLAVVEILAKQAGDVAEVI